MSEIRIDRLEPNIKKIEENLVLANLLVENRIGNYRLLYCFMRGGYNIRDCFETCPDNVFECTIEFIEKGYLIEK